MDRAPLIPSATEELRQIRSDTRLAKSLDVIRRNFDRLQDLRRQTVDNFELQLAIADAQQEIIERAQALRKASEGTTTGAPLLSAQNLDDTTALVSLRRGSPRQPELPLAPEEQPAEIPPDVPKLEKKSWQLAVGLAVLFTVGIFASFFYLIQTARRLNFPEENVAPPNPQTPVAAKPSPASTTPPGVTPAVSITPTLRLYTDLQGGTATLDDQPPKDLTDGELNLDSIAPGTHTMHIEGRSGSAAFNFSVDDDKSAPKMTKILKTNNAMLVLVSVKDGAGSLHSDADDADVELDDKPAGTVGADGLILPGLGKADHNLLVSQNRDRQKFVLTYTPAPTLTVFVKSDPSTGVLTVSTGLDGVQVFINDLPYSRLTAHGGVRIPLKVGSYRIRVHKLGYEDPAIAMVDVKKSAEASVQFHLQPAPQEASLQLKAAQPGMVASIDHQVVATVGPDGTAKAANIKPGIHIVELEHDGAITKELGRTFEAGKTLTLTGPDVMLDHLAADNKTVIPANPSATYIPPPEVPQLQTASAPASTAEQVHKGGGFIPYHTPRTPGRYYFEAHGKVGGVLKHSKLEWYAGYQDPQNYILFSLDGKHAEVKEVRAGKQIDLGKTPFTLGSDEWVQVEMTVRANTLQVRAKAGIGEWTPLTPVSAEDHDFTKDAMGMYVPENDEVATANFRFTGQ